uniref:Uncharacterized protein n=1 Tax=Rousettus aegyptiacus TaxID=9407 RepID=A0A7J8IMD9_ROUAE|nr:hypothetical protein HJG63_010564 [Rousettus aegyptiacus]
MSAVERRQHSNELCKETEVEIIGLILQAYGFLVGLLAVATFDLLHIQTYSSLCFSQVISGKRAGLVGGCEGVDHDLLFPNPISEPNIQALKVFFQTGETLLKEWPSVVLVNYLGLLLVKCQELLLNFCFFLQDIRGPHLLVNFFQPFYPG